MNRKSPLPGSGSWDSRGPQNQLQLQKAFGVITTRERNALTVEENKFRMMVLHHGPVLNL